MISLFRLSKRDGLVPVKQLTGGCEPVKGVYAMLWRLRLDFGQKNNHKGLGPLWLFGLVGLSSLDENKLDRIIAHRRSARKAVPNNTIIACNPSPVNNTTALISADGETVARQLRQIQRRDFSEADIAAIIASYTNGMITSDIAAKYGCHRKTISGILKKNGVEVSKKKIKSEEEVNRILVLYERNHTIEEIANQFGVGVTVINRLLHRHGAEVRSRWDYEK